MTRRNTYRRYHHPRGTRGQNRSGLSPVATLLAGSALVGAALGLGSVATTPDGREAVAAFVKDVGVSTGMARARAPEAGDHWRGCDDARAAGTAPIYRGEPGYRDGLDGDDDGIACEPYHGR